MSQHERLVELLTQQRGMTLPACMASQTIELLADALLASNIIAPPVKVGQRIWINGILGVGRCEEHEITSVSVYIGQKTDIWFNAEMVEYRGEARCSFGIDQFGKTVFLTQKAAENALKEETE